MSLEMTPELWRKCAKKQIKAKRSSNPVTKPVGINPIKQQPLQEFEPQKVVDDGFKISFDIKDFQDEKESPFNKANKYGYQINISHKAIYPYYKAYMLFIKEPYLLSDGERADFEKRVITALYEIGITK